MLVIVLVLCCFGARGESSVSCRLDNGLLLASVVWLNIVKKKK